MTEPVSYVIPEDPDNPHRLGRAVHHDPRSRRFAFTADDTVLTTVWWPRAVEIFDQGQTSSCTGNAAAGWLATANALRPGMAVYPWGAQGATYPVDEKYALSIYGRATNIDPFPGAYPPDDVGSDGLSVTKVLQERGFVDSYAHAFDVGSTLAALMTGPVLVGTVWRRDMFRPGPAGLVTATGDVVGGHEYLLIGYNAEAREVIFANSWGPGWGDGGYGRMTVDTLTALLAHDGDATVPHAAVAAPSPEPTPAADGWFPSDAQKTRLTKSGNRARPPRTWQEQTAHVVDYRYR